MYSRKCESMRTLYTMLLISILFPFAGKAQSLNEIRNLLSDDCSSSQEQIGRVAAREILRECSAFPDDPSISILGCATAEDGSETVYIRISWTGGISESNYFLKGYVGTVGNTSKTMFILEEYRGLLDCIDNWESMKDGDGNIYYVADLGSLDY